MNEQTDALNQYHLLVAVRTLLQTVQEPLAPLAEALQAPEQLLADLTPALDVVAFSPFAGLTVSTPEPQSSGPKPPLRSTATPTVATPMSAATNQSALPPAALPSQRLAPPAASVNISSSTTVTPVFALPSQKRMVPSAASPLAQAAASVAQQVAQPTTSSPVAVAANPMAKADHISPLLENGQSGLSVKPSARSDDPVRTDDDMATLPPLTTMTLLATLVDSLLTTTPPTRLEAAAHREPRMASSSSPPAPPLSPASGHRQWPVDYEPALHSLRAINQPLATFADQSSFTSPLIDAPTPPFAGLLAEWPAARGENQPINQSTNQPTPDPWTLAQLINDVLAEEARRHGVDLS